MTYHTLTVTGCNTFTALCVGGAFAFLLWGVVELVRKAIRVGRFSP